MSTLLIRDQSTIYSWKYVGRKLQQKKMADDLKGCENVNFGAQYDAQAPKLAETLIIPVPDAQTFLRRHEASS